MNDKPKTVRVRIAVAVDTQGNWSASGWKTDDESMRDVVIDMVEGGLMPLVHFIEADIPIPVSEAITGKVVE